MAALFYKPENAWAADFIPFYQEGRFRLFYLHDWRSPAEHGEGTPWYQISTDDFVRFTEHGEMLPRGSRDEQDLYVFTGSADQCRGAVPYLLYRPQPPLPSPGKTGAGGDARGQRRPAALAQDPGAHLLRAG